MVALLILSRFGLMINTLAENLRTFSWFPGGEKQNGK